MKKTFIFLGFLGASITAFSQIKLTQVHLSSGAYRQFGFTPSNITDFAPLAPGSSILMKDFSNYEGEMGYYNFIYPFNMGMQNNSSSNPYKLVYRYLNVKEPCDWEYLISRIN